MIGMKLIDEDQLETLLEHQKKRPGQLLGQIAIELEMITDEQLAQALAQQQGMQAISLADRDRARVLTYVTEPDGHLYRICPIAFRDNTLTVAMCDPAEAWQCSTSCELPGTTSGGGTTPRRSKSRSTLTIPTPRARVDHQRPRRRQRFQRQTEGSQSRRRFD